MWEGLNDAIPRIAAMAKETGGIVFDCCKAGAHKVAGGPIKFVTKSATAAYDKVKQGVTSVSDKVKSEGKKAYASATSAGNDVYNGVAAVGDGLKNTIKGSVKLAAEGIEDKPVTISTVAEDKKKAQIKKDEKHGIVHHSDHAHSYNHGSSSSSDTANGGDQEDKVPETMVRTKSGVLKARPIEHHFYYDGN